jgi:hypothetical protein
LITKTDDSDSPAQETYSETKEDIDLSVKLSKKLTDTISFKAKLDCEDTASDGDLVEEAYVTWKKALGDNVDLAFGRKELKFGQDRYLWENDGKVHDYSELDNKLALEFGIKAGDAAKIYITNWQAHDDTYTDEGDTGGADDDVVKARDSFLFQSFALKGEIKAADNLKVNVSYLNEHDESQLEDSVVETPKDDGFVPNHSRISVGVDYNDKDMGLRAWFEYLMLTAIGYVDGYTGSIIQVGVKYKVDPKLEVGLNFETYTASVDNDKATGMHEDEETSSQIVVGAAYYPDSKNPVVLEIVLDNETKKDGPTSVETKTGKTTITIGTILKF